MKLPQELTHSMHHISLNQLMHLVTDLKLLLILHYGVKLHFHNSNNQLNNSLVMLLTMVHLFKIKNIIQDII